jgi:hypothetical protein
MSSVFIQNDELKTLLVEYIVLRFPGAPEVVPLFRAIWTRFPKYLRVKEFFETVEAYKKICEQISSVTNALQAGKEQDNRPRRKGKTKPKLHIYDLACGHGLLGRPKHTYE